MYHSVIFGDKNTWDDWQLVPQTRPFFAPPAPKVKTVDIPGGDGLIDLTESLTGYPVYSNRTGSIDFIVVNDFYEPVSSHEEWFKVYSRIMNYIHGQKMIAYLEDDPDWYYEGRFSVGSWKSGKNYSEITINYDVGPYKWSKKTFREEVEEYSNWLWDPFSFVDGVIWSNFNDITITAGDGWKKYEFKTDLIGRAPVCPVFDIELGNGATSLDIRFVNNNLGIEETKGITEDGSYQFDDWIFYGDVEVWMRCNGIVGPHTSYAIVNLDFRRGSL